jgi:hypothetical protein
LGTAIAIWTKRGGASSRSRRRRQPYMAVRPSAIDPTIGTKGYCVVQPADGGGLCGVLDHSMNLLSVLAAGTIGHAQQVAAPGHTTTDARRRCGERLCAVTSVAASLPGKSALRDERA